MKNEADFNKFNSIAHKYKSKAQKDRSVYDLGPLAADYGDPPVVDFDPSDLTDVEFINFLKHHHTYKMTKKEIERLPDDICKKVMAQAVIENL